MAKEAFRWQSVVSGKKDTSPRLVRWDVSKPPTIDNLALMSKSEYETHLKFPSLEAAKYPLEVMERF